LLGLGLGLGLGLEAKFSGLSLGLETSGLGRPAELLLVNSVVGGAEPHVGGELARAWTDWRSEGALHQCPDDAQGSAEGTVATE